MTTVTWKCPKCKTEAEIKGKTKSIKTSISPEKAKQGFPTHQDCELAKPVHKIDFSKLIKVREE